LLTGLKENILATCWLEGKPSSQQGSAFSASRLYHFKAKRYSYFGNVRLHRKSSTGWISDLFWH
jgi:hypothetical protein